MTWHTGTVHAGDVLRITKLVDNWGVDISDDAWGIALDDEDMMVFIKREKPGHFSKQAVGGWSSQVCPIGWADEDTRAADADDVPKDIPDDFWPLAARLSLER